MKKYFNQLFVAISIFALFSCSHSQSEKQVIKIATAASMSHYVSQVSDSLEKRFPVRIEINTASSGQLAHQVAQGYPADIFLSANKQWSEYLHTKGWTDSTFFYCFNKLVFVLHQTAFHEYSHHSFIEACSKTKQIAMGDPAYVPAGHYANMILTDSLQEIDKSKLIYLKDVQAVRSLIDQGQCEAGFIYLSEFYKSKNLHIHSSFDKAGEEQIVVYLQKRKDADPLVDSCFHYLYSPKLRDILIEHGFSIKE